MGDASFGKYRLIAELGHGGMADVFLAVIAGPAGSGFSKLAVVKRLRQNLAEEPEFVEMLVDEARISARLNHPNVVQTNEVGSVGNQYFLAMEYLDGQPLHRIQHRAQQKAAKATQPEAKDGAPAEAAAAAAAPSNDLLPKECQYVVLADALAGLHHAHELADYDGTPLEIVHRDVTPHNVFVTYEGQTKVVDFGIAKAIGRSSETRQGVVKGKIRYMAPEQALGQKVDRRADIFAVGIMLWEVAVGKRLWAGVDDMNIVQALVAGQVKRSPREINPDVPEELDRICVKALAHSADDRYQTAEEMRLDIEAFLVEKGLLVSARRKLGSVVAELFKDKRTEIRSIIEKQLAQLKNHTSGAFEPVQVSLESGPSSMMQVASGSGGTAVMPGAPARAPEDGPTSITDAATELWLDGKGKGSRLPPRMTGLIAGVGVLVVALGVIVISRATSHSASANVDPPGTTSATPSATSNATPQQQQEVHVHLVPVPATARMTLDGALLSSPYDARLPRDANTHVVRIEAPGYDTRIESVRFDSDVDLNLPLTKHEAGKPTVVAAAPTKPVWGVHPKGTAAATPDTPSASPPPPPPPPPPTTTTTTTGHPKTPTKPTIDTSEDPWKKPGQQ